MAGVHAHSSNGSSGCGRCLRQLGARMGRVSSSKLGFALVVLITLVTFHNLFQFSYFTAAVTAPPARNPRVAWAIPVGGRTRRVPALDTLLETLVAQGAGPENVFVFEDNGGRGFINDPDLRACCTKWGVHLEQTNIERPAVPENTRIKFGLYLARHYHAMMDFVFLRSREDPQKRVYDYAVLIEDDLFLAPDAVKFFTEMSTVMEKDPTVYCVSAHADNAFPAFARDPAGPMTPFQFDFRRGSHFMAPGWMTSRRLYTEHLRPSWMDKEGNLLHQEEFGMLNSNWDMYMEVRIEGMDCIFPEVPRVSHRGGGGFTVSKESQLALFGNLLLSDYADTPSNSYGDLRILEKDNYKRELVRVMEDAIHITDVGDIAKHRASTLMLTLDATKDDSTDWTELFSGYFGVNSLGGHPGHAKMRAVFEGTVVVRWLTNLVVVVGMYSPLLQDLSNQRRSAIERTLTERSKLAASFQVVLKYEGCFKDSRERDLPFFALNASPLTPERCMVECVQQGFRYAGLQSTECWCGDQFGAEGPERDGVCHTRCGKGSHRACGGPWANSVYSQVNPGTGPLFQERVRHPFDDDNGVRYVAAQAAESCDSACAATGSVCEVSLFPAFYDSRVLKELFDCTKSSVNVGQYDRLAGPGLAHDGTCVLAHGRYFNCNYKPEVNSAFRRACVCAGERLV